MMTAFDIKLGRGAVLQPGGAPFAGAGDDQELAGQGRR
jgi:hypothetical protein